MVCISVIADHSSFLFLHKYLVADYCLFLITGRLWERNDFVIETLWSYRKVMVKNKTKQTGFAVKSVHSPREQVLRLL